MLEFIKKRKIILIILAVLIVVGLVGAKLISSNGAIDTTTPVIGNLVRTVKIAGKVTPKESVLLGFETAGIVSSISKDVGDVVRRGDVLVRLDSSTISSEVLQAQAELSLAEAELKKLEGASTFEAQIDNAKRALIQTIKDAFTDSDDAVHNKTDQIFIDPRSSRPEMVYAFGDHYDLRDSVISSRILVDEKLDDWESLIAGLSIANYTDEHLFKSKQYLSEVSAYINNVAQAVNLFKTGGSLTQASIDDYKSAALSARNNLNTATSDLITAEDKFRGLLSDVPVQVARVESARASLSNNRAQLAKTYLTSPINGVVSRQDAKVGQVVSAASDLVRVLSKELEIEAFIPEILISGVKIGNDASVTLDAYGEEDLFEAKVVHLDPAETIRDGVSTYKVRLAFALSDERVRPGMTANINIETFKKADVTLIPERTVTRDGDKAFVTILEAGNNQKEVLVEVGDRDSFGNIELITELPLESRLIINPANE